MTENAAVKIGLEALSQTFDDGLTDESVEICMLIIQDTESWALTELKKHISKL